MVIRFPEGVICEKVGKVKVKVPIGIPGILDPPKLELFIVNVKCSDVVVA